jgi:hypothetical protein
MRCRHFRADLQMTRLAPAGLAGGPLRRCCGVERGAALARPDALASCNRALNILDGMAVASRCRRTVTKNALSRKRLQHATPVILEVCGLAHMVLMTTGYHHQERRLRPGSTTHRT